MSLNLPPPELPPMRGSSPASDPLPPAGSAPVAQKEPFQGTYPVSLIFFSNGDGSRGYLIRGDKPLGQQAETVCVESVYRDVRLNDIAKPGVPAWAKMGGAAATANAICKRDHLGYQELCGFHDESVIGLDRNGQHVMLVATGTAINPRDKSVRQNQRITVTVRPDEMGGLVKASTPEGASYMLSAYTKVSYTQNAKVSER